MTWRRVDGRTEVDIPLEAAGSVFVVFREPTTAVSGKAPVRCAVTTPIDLVGKWNVVFNTTGRHVDNTDLFDWTTSVDNDVRYYSGTATYTASFKAPSYKKGNRVMLDLSGLHDVATVKVNGVDCGIVWAAPYSVDITDALRKGVNELTVDVTNTWANALLGADEGTPPFEGIWTNGKYRRADAVTLPAGLTGPVEITVISEKR